jgi:hypothetical protein
MPRCQTRTGSVLACVAIPHQAQRYYTVTPQSREIADDGAPISNIDQAECTLPRWFAENPLLHTRQHPHAARRWEQREDAKNTAFKSKEFPSGVFPIRLAKSIVNYFYKSLIFSLNFINIHI